jgi:hypothetical protein
MKNHTLLVFSLVTAGLATSCGYTTPYRTSGPAFSKDGVQITLAGEECYVNRSTEQFPIALNDIDDVLHVGVNLQVRNDSKHVAVLSLDGFQLSEDTKTERLVMHPQESGSLSLAPGETKLVALDFQQQTELDCHHDLALAAQGAVAIEGRPVYLAGIHFQPSH